MSIASLLYGVLPMRTCDLRECTLTRKAASVTISVLGVLRYQTYNIDVFGHAVCCAWFVGVSNKSKNFGARLMTPTLFTHKHMKPVHARVCSIRFLAARSYTRNDEANVRVYARGIQLALLFVP